MNMLISATDWRQNSWVGLCTNECGYVLIFFKYTFYPADQSELGFELLSWLALTPKITTSICLIFFNLSYSCKHLFHIRFLPLLIQSIPSMLSRQPWFKCSSHLETEPCSFPLCYVRFLCLSIFAACESTVALLFDAVMHLGCKPYLDSQRAACVCQYEVKKELWHNQQHNRLIRRRYKSSSLL